MPPPTERVSGAASRVTSPSGAFTRPPVEAPVTRRPPVVPSAMRDGFEVGSPVTIVPPDRNTTARGITANQLRAIMPAVTAERAAQMLPHINRAMQEANINTPRRQAAFLAQIAVESGQLSDFTENGNNSPYKGRGPIQITGRGNYAAAGRALGVDLVSNPDQLATNPALGFRAAAWFWSANNVNRHADRGDLLSVSRTVNFGRANTTEMPNHYDRRQSFYRTALRVLEQ